MSWSWYIEVSKAYQAAATSVSVISFVAAFLGTVLEVSAFAVIAKRGRIGLAIAVVVAPAVLFALAAVITVALALPTGQITGVFVPPTMLAIPALAAFYLVRQELKNVRDGHR